MYVYIRSEPGLWTVGHYSPDGKWHTDSDHDTAEAAAQRVHWLNGGSGQEIKVAAARATQAFQAWLDENGWDNPAYGALLYAMKALAESLRCPLKLDDVP